MTTIAVIGGTGMNQWPGLKIEKQKTFDTPYGPASAPLVFGTVAGVSCVFLARHGEGHKLPPHKINYRANIWALKQAGANNLIAIAAVGGISKSLPPAAVAVPDDVIDYTFGREHTYSDGGQAPLQHVELTHPYTPALRTILLKAAKTAKVKVMNGGVMGVTQGPRLETPAEIARMKRDGCDMVGMTGMPEAALARELDLNYAGLALSVNWAAGIGTGDIHGEIERCIADGMKKIHAILKVALPVMAAR